VTWLRRAIVVAVVGVLGWLLPTLFFDDAYITFRYAANLAAGKGFTYNPPERVLGTTSPLHTLLLALAARFGLDIETAALILGVAGQALMCLMVFESLRRLLAHSERPGFSIPLVGALLCAAHPHLALTAMGGMETPLYVALILALLLAAARGMAAATGVLAGLALLARPDAVLVFPPAAWLLGWARAGNGTGGPLSAATASRPRAAVAGRRLVIALVCLIVVAGPWMVFATSYFGSPVPHSIAAKRLIHPFGPLQVLIEFGSFLMDDPLLALAIPLAIWGLERRRRTRLAIGLGAFCLLYLTAYVFSGVTPFPWYVNPLLPPVLMLGLVGLDDLLSRVRRRRLAWAVASILIVGVAGWQLRKQASELRDSWDAWEGQYEVAGRWILNDSKPGDKVLVGETGVIGYLLPDRIILDSSGINSPEIYKMRRGRAETDPQWTRDVIEVLRPDYITTSISYLNIRAISEEPWFTSRYKRVELLLLEREGQLLFKRR
jgi:hypothetical protein